MRLTEEEIRQILIAEKRRKRQRSRRRRRILLLIVLVLAAVLAIGLYLNRDVLYLSLNRGVIFIDAAHGGLDPGSEGLGRKEKDDTLELALAVKRELRSRGYKVYLSREEDKDMVRDDIGDMANDCSADLMVSIHRNQANDASAKGVEVWIPAAGDEISTYLGNAIMKELKAEGFEERLVRPGTLTDENDDYAENAYSDMPSCLVEVGFVSNKADNKLFDKNLDDNAAAIADAIEETHEKFFEEDEADS